MTCIFSPNRQTDVLRVVRELQKRQEEDRKRQEEDRKRQKRALDELAMKMDDLKKPKPSITTHASAGSFLLQNATITDPKHLLRLTALPVPPEVLDCVLNWEACQNEEQLQVRVATKSGESAAIPVN